MLQGSTLLLKHGEAEPKLSPKIQNSWPLRKEMASCITFACPGRCSGVSLLPSVFYTASCFPADKSDTFSLCSNKFIMLTEMASENNPASLICNMYKNKKIRRGYDQRQGPFLVSDSQTSLEKAAFPTGHPPTCRIGSLHQ